MALYGSVSTNKYNNKRYYKVSWQATQDIATNTSTISYTIEALGGTGYYAERTLKVTIGGTTVISKTNRVERYAGVIKTDTVKLSHDAEGNKNFTINIEVACYEATVNLTAEKTFALDPIARKATIINAPDFTDEQNPTITFSNPLGSKVNLLRVCISFDGTAANIAYREVSKTATSYTFNLTDAERAVLQNGTTTSVTRSIRFYIETTIDGEIYRHYVTKTLTIANCAPTLNPTATDIGSVSTTLTGDGNIIIKGYNVVSVSNGAKAYKGATIAKRWIRCGTKTIEADSGTLSYVDSNEFVFTVIDSRGQQETQTITKEFVDYFRPNCVLNMGSINATGEANFTIEGNAYTGNIGKTDNDIVVDYRIKQDSGDYGNWVTVEETESDNTYTAQANLTGLDYKSTYTFQARVRDAIYSGEGEAATLSNEITIKIQPIFDWGKNDFAFNVPISIEGAALDDFIVEQGTNNGWYYRKWNNGRAECWKILTLTTKINSAWGSLFVGTTKMSRQNYPFGFTAKPVEIATLQCGNSAGWLMTESAGTGVNGTYASAIYNIARPTAVTTDNTFYISLYVCGTYK